MATESIIKDSFYKERLLQTAFNSPGDEVNIHSQQPIPEKILKQSLSNFGKISAGNNYAYRDFTCNYHDIQSLVSLTPYVNLETIDVSNNRIGSLKPLSTLRFLVSINASLNILTSIDFKHVPYSLDTLNCSFNQISKIPNMSQHKFLRNLCLRNNNITKIQGVSNVKTLRILDLSQNQIQDIQNLDGLNLTELYLSSNKIQVVKGLTKLDKLRILDLSMNEISKIMGLSHLISLRKLLLSKNKVRHIRQLSYIENLAYISEVDLCYNSIQERRYYRQQVLYKLPMLKVLDGTPVSPEEVVKAQNLHGLDVDERHRIFEKILPEEQFIDRRIHTSELVEPQSDSGGQEANFIDKYDQHGALTQELNRSRGSNNSRRSKDKSFSASKQSFQSKMSKLSAIQ